MAPVEAESARAAALKKLQAHGERFMAMFDDDGARPSTSGRDTGKPKKARATPGPIAAAPPAQKGAESPIGARRKPTSVKQPAATPSPATPGAARGVAGTSARSQAEPAAAGGKKRKPTANEIDSIMRAGAAKKARVSPAAKHGTAAAAKSPAPQPPSESLADAARRERKLFMSHKASKVHAAAAVPQARKGRGTPDAADNDGLSPEDFRKLQVEIEKFAATSLDKKDAKAYKARMLARVGAKADVGPRTAASIGKGMAKMDAKRKARALEEAIESGMVQRKGLGKKKRAEQAKKRDRGLMEAGPSFKGGILRVKPLKKQKGGGGPALRLPKGVMG